MASGQGRDVPGLGRSVATVEPGRGGQPMPVGLQVVTVGPPERPWTSIARAWASGDTARCKLCPVCTADPAGFCLIVTPGVVHPRAAALFVLREGYQLGAGRDSPRPEWLARPWVVAPRLDGHG